MKLKLTVAALAAMLTVPAMAGTPDVVPTPAPEPAPAAEPVTIEIGASYGFATKDIVDWPFIGMGGKKVHMLGGDITSVYSIDENNAATLRLGYGTGASSKTSAVYNERERYRLHTFALMPGYRYSIKADDALTCYVGVSAGVTNSSLKYKETDLVDGSRWTAHGSEWGFGYSAEIGASYAISEGVSVFLAYEFSGNSARPKFTYYTLDTISANQQVYHTIRAGVSCQF